MRFFLSLLLCFSSVSFAGRLPHSIEESPADSKKFKPLPQEQRMQKRFGVGLSAGGGAAKLGFEVDVNLTEDFSLSGTWGTGFDYSTFAVRGRYFLLGNSLSPYLGLGLARWWSNGTREKDFSPAILKNEFLADGKNTEDGFSVFILYPTVGVQFLHSSGFSASFELEYMFRMFTLANGTYAGLGAHWYF